MTVRAKFKCVGKHAYWKNNDAQQNASIVHETIRLEPVVEGSPENRIFGNATPVGSIEMVIHNDDAFQQFVLGQEYYVDFTPARQETQTDEGGTLP